MTFRSDHVHKTDHPLKYNATTVLNRKPRRLPPVVAWLRGAGHSADSFATV